MEHAQKTIEILEEKLQELVAQEVKIKTTINCLCDVMGEPIRYPEIGGDTGKRTGPPRKDQYFGRPLATVATEALEKRRAAGLGAATDDELYAELSAGGFEFKGKDKTTQKRIMAITLAKNPKFTRVGGEAWGLTAWYPEAAKARAKKRNGKAECEEVEDTEDAVIEDMVDRTKGRLSHLTPELPAANSDGPEKEQATDAEA